MAIHIEFDTDDLPPDEMTALIALLHSLGGRLPGTAERRVGMIAEIAAGYSPTTVTRVEEDHGGHPTSSSTSGAASRPSPSSAPQTESGGTTGPDVGAPDRDSAGLPWDGRIHAESKATVADGTWRKRRNVADEVVESVTAELRARDGADAPPPPPAVDDTPEPPTPADAPPPPPVTGPAGDKAKGMADFAKLIGRVAKAEKDGTLDPARKTEVAGLLGLSSIRDLATRLDLIDQFATLIFA